MNEITSIPRRTWRGRILCYFGRHKWMRTGARSVVIPTGTALLIRQRVQPILCGRAGCHARKEDVYKREEWS